MTFLRLDNIHKSYRLGKHTIQVLNGVDVSINDGEMVTIIGPSGVGKSTLLHIIGTLDRPTRGQVLFNGEDIFLRPEKELAYFRNQTIGFVFQFHHLLTELTALENVMMPGLIARKKREEIHEKALTFLNRIGLAHRLDHKPGELSGGEQQRVAVARALMNDPKIVLADEPSGNLDQKSAQSLHDLMRQLCCEEKKTFMIVTHNEELAALSDTKIRLMDGKVYCQSKN